MTVLVSNIAAHCFHDKLDTLLSSKFFAGFAKTLRGVDQDEDHAQFREISKIHIMPDYGGESLLYTDDIALAELDREVAVTAWTLPVCVDWKRALPDLRPGEVGSVVGFGGAAVERDDDALRMARLPFVSRADCRKFVVGKLAAYNVVQDKFCVGFVPDAAIGRGDSGGGLAFPDKNRVWFLRGVVSVGSSQTADYSFFTNVTAFVPWMASIIPREEETTVLKTGSETFTRWVKPAVQRHMRVYIFNVTNADAFVNDGEKPIVNEVGPYVYRETWEKVAVSFNGNGTVSFQQKKVFKFDPEQSVGDTTDNVVVPNVPMLSATSQSVHSSRYLRLAMASIMDILKIKPFVEVSVDQLLWGYEDPLLKLAKDVLPKEQRLPYDDFGIFYGKNGTAKEVVTIFTGATDITRTGLIDRFDGQSALPYWKTDACNRIDGSDGSVFPPHITRNTNLYVYDKEMCRLLPLRFFNEVETNGGVHGYRFTPPDNVFADVSQNPENSCYCPSGPPCAPHGLMNVSVCQFDSPYMMSFPHFYMADPTLRDAVAGIAEPDPEKHKFYIDVDPKTGVALGARARVQMNLAVRHTPDIKQVATIPDIVFPIVWFEDGF